MKILHIISGDLWAGAEVQAFTLLTALQKIPDVELAAVLMNEGELAQRLRERNISVIVLPETSLSPIAIFLKLCRLLRDWHPDIVHTHRIKENILGSIANRLTVNVPSVRTVHGAAEHTPKGLRNIPKRMLSALNTWTGQYLQNRIIAVSAELATKLEHEFPRDKIVVIENGVDIDAVRAQVQPVDFKLNQPNAIHIGIIGRLVPVKRIDIFLATAALLHKESPQHDWRFHIIGSGPLEQTLKQQAHELEIFERTTFHGHRSDIIACIAALDALVMCSDHEGMPMTLLEAMCLGKIIIGHNVGGIKELLQEGKNGWPVSFHSEIGYAEALHNCLLDESIAHIRTESAKHLVIKFSAASCAKRHLDLYGN